MKSNKYTLFIFLLFLLITKVNGQELHDNLSSKSIDDSLIIKKPQPLKAGMMVIGSNVVVWAFDRYVLKGDYAYISWKTMKRNLSHAPVWDHDKFSTNLFGHPYQGSWYFNAARDNGMNFWQSAPYSLFGSAMWEYLMENEPPSINDFMTTTFGGIYLGEMTYRISDLIIDDRSRGFERVGREFLATLISPLRGVNRMINGDMFRIRRIKGHVFHHKPLFVSLSAGARYLAQHNKYLAGSYGGVFNARMVYGDTFEEEQTTPFDWFQVKASFNVISNQPMLGQINSLASLWRKEIYEKGNKKMSVGIFQHFDYYDSEIAQKGEDIVPYRIAETVSFGGGLLYQSKKNTERPRYIAELYVNGILLGGSLTDYYKEGDRDYNLGSGYSVKYSGGIFLNQHWSFLIAVSHYHIFTWKGYNPDQPEPVKEHGFLNLQGDKGNARLSVMNTLINYQFNKHYALSLSNDYYYRKSHYAYYPNVRYRTFDSRLLFSYIF